MQADGSYPGYHTTADTPDRVHYETIVSGTDLIEAAIRS